MDWDDTCKLYYRPSIELLPTKFRFICPGSYRGEDFLEIDQPETRIGCGSHVCNWIGTK